jgi:hypothetical protein
MRLLTAQAIADEGTLEVMGHQLPEQSKPARALMGVTPQLDNLEVQAPQGADQAQMEQQLRQSMQQQNMGEQLAIKESESRTVSVEGKDTDFLFSTATNLKDNSEWRQVTGAFPGKNGTAFINLQQPADKFDEDAVVQMLESIKTK